MLRIRNVKGLFFGWPAATLVCLAVAAVAAGLRYGVVESPPLAFRCQESLATPWWCPLRQLLVELLIGNALGALSVVILAIAFLKKSRSWAVAAVASGTAGLLLLNPDWSAVAFVGGLLLIAPQREAGRDQTQERPQ